MAAPTGGSDGRCLGPPNLGKLGGRDGRRTARPYAALLLFYSIVFPALRVYLIPRAADVVNLNIKENSIDPNALKPLPQEFYLQPTRQVARELIGGLLVHRVGGKVLVGRLVETEAYLAVGDPGCHAARGKTDRNAPMFGPPGTVYVYLIYGMHLCMNLVTQPEGTAEAVLLRAAEPLAGIGAMRERRGRHALKDLCSGPAKLTEAFGVTLEHNRGDVTDGRLFVAPAPDPPAEVAVTTRIGLGEGCGEDLMLRYLVPDSPWLSRTPKPDAPVRIEER